MAKIIAVCGIPHSGKTVTSLKLAQEIYVTKKNAKVILVSPDLKCPSMTYIFPNGKDEEIYSLGKALDKTDISVVDIYSSTVTVKTMKNFGLLGYKIGENEYSYPFLTEDKIIGFFKCLNEMADYIVFDCTCDDDLMSIIAKRECDIAIEILTNDLYCPAYLFSNKDRFISIKNKKYIVLNSWEEDLVYKPMNELSHSIEKIDYTIPFSLEIRHQLVCGSLSEMSHDKKYRKAIFNICEAVI